ncbi:MAG: hypothetical protein L6300_16000, partial [Syntrophaceae bacterium]|nr:hypothetical protein [Syntrophaceae bacterium]
MFPLRCTVTASAPLLSAYSTLANGKRKSKKSHCGRIFYFFSVFKKTSVSISGLLSRISRASQIRRLIHKPLMVAVGLGPLLSKTVFRENWLKMSSSWEIVVLANKTKSQDNKEDGEHGTLCKPFSQLVALFSKQKFYHLVKDHQAERY